MHSSRPAKKRKSSLLLAFVLASGVIAAGEGSSIYYYYDPINDSYTFTNMCPDLRACKPLFVSKGAVHHRKGYRPAEQRYDDLIRRAADEFGVDFHLIKSVVKAESQFDPDAKSSKGAMGLMQLMPDTAKLLGVRNAYDPGENIRGGTKYLRDMLRKFGSVEKALAAYNAGPAAVVYYNGVPPFRETQDYLAKIQRFYQEYTGKRL